MRQFRYLLIRIEDVLEELTFTGPGPTEYGDEDENAVSYKNRAVRCIPEAVLVEIADQAPLLKLLKFVGAEFTPAAMTAIGRIASLESLSLIRSDVTLEDGEISDEIRPLAELPEAYSVHSRCS